MKQLWLAIALEAHACNCNLIAPGGHERFRDFICREYFASIWANVIRASEEETT